jgi:hypothetical protein
MSLPRVLRTQQGQQITLGKQLGSGGEGIVYEVQGIPSIAAKIYHPDKATEREHKIRAMVSAGWHKTAWASPCRWYLASGRYMTYILRLVVERLFRLPVSVFSCALLSILHEP